MDRYLLAIKRGCRDTRTRTDLVECTTGIQDLQIVGSTAERLVIRATPKAIVLLNRRVQAWCHVEKEIVYRPSVAGPVAGLAD